MGRLIAILFVVLSWNIAVAQDTAYVVTSHRSLVGDYTDFSADELGNIYLVSNRATIKKINDRFDSVAVYNGRKRYGNITSIDAGNPLKILVFYKETATIVILDQLLSEKQVIDLRKSNVLRPAAIRLSYDNNTWVFDEMDNKIKKIDQAGKLIMQTDDLRSIAGQAYSFNTLIDDRKSLYCYDTACGWFVFDYYGAFVKKYPFTGWKNVQVLNDRMIGHIDSGIAVAGSGNFGFKTIKSNLPVNGAIKRVLAPRHAFILYPGKLEIYDAP